MPGIERGFVSLRKILPVPLWLSFFFEQQRVILREYYPLLFTILPESNDFPLMEIFN